MYAVQGFQKLPDPQRLFKAAMGTLTDGCGFGFAFVHSRHQDYRYRWMPNPESVKDLKTG